MYGLVTVLHVFNFCGTSITKWHKGSDKVSW